MGREKSYTQFAHAQDFCKFGNFCSVTLTSVRHAGLLLCERCQPLTTLSVDNDKEAMKAISSSLAGLSVPKK